jgi:hypothetical protein
MATTDPAEQERAKIEAQNAAIEAAAVAAVTAALARRLEAIAAILTSPMAWTTARATAAARLRSMSVNLHDILHAKAVAGAHVGAAQAGLALPDAWMPGDDPALTAVLDAIERCAKDRARAVARTVAVATPDQVDELKTAIAGVEKAPRASAVSVAHRSIASGFTAATNEAGVARMWTAERDACPACLAYSGRIAGAGEDFPGGLTFGDHPLPWSKGGIGGPPLHPHCRCHLMLADIDVSIGLQREAERSVARGWSAYSSLPARLRAVDRLLQSGSRLPTTVVTRARRDLRRGSFSDRHTPRLPYRSGRA